MSDHRLQEVRAVRAFLDNCAVVAYAAVMAHRGLKQGPEWISLRWPQADKREREAMLKAVTHWTVGFVDCPNDPQHMPQPTCFSVQEHQIIKGVVEAIRIYTPSGIERPCLREAGLSVTTAFLCERPLDHKGPCLPAFVPEPEDVTP